MIGSRRVVAIILLLAFAISVIAYRSHQLNQPDQPAFHTGAIRVAVDPSQPPFAYYDENNDLVGLDIDLANALGKVIGLPIEIQISGIDGLYDALENDNVDLIISAIHPESWRMGDVFYSRPYFDAGLMLVTNQESDIYTIRDLPGHSLAYAFGSAADTESRIWDRRVESFEHRPYELPSYALDAVRLNEADAALVDAVSTHLYLRDYPDWLVTTTYLTHHPLTIAVNIDHPETLNSVNKTLTELIDSGQLDEIISRWL